MATFLSPTHMTISEAVELMQYKGDKAFIKQLEKKSYLMQVMPWFKTSDGAIHKGVKATALPSGAFGAFNKAVPTGSAATKAYQEGVKVFELKSVVDDRLLSGHSDAERASIRAGRDRLYSLGFLQSFADKVVHSDGTDPDSFMGLLARRAKVDDTHTFSLGATGSVGSILLIRPGEDGVCFRYPQTYPSFEKIDKGEIEELELDKSTGKVLGSFPAWLTLWRVWAAIDVADEDALIRIGNISTTTAMTDTDTDKLIDIVDSLPDQGQGYIAIGPQKVISQFKKYLKNKDNIAFSKEAIEGMGAPTHLFNIPLFTEKYMSAAETVIK